MTATVPGVPDPHGGAVEVDQHPLVGVEVEAVRQLHPVQERPELRADEGATRVRRVYVEPQSLTRNKDRSRCKINCRI